MSEVLFILITLPDYKFVMKNRKIITKYSSGGIIAGYKDLILIFCVLTPLSAIFQLYHGDQF
jgi:hypothetical protein